MGIRRSSAGQGQTSKSLVAGRAQTTLESARWRISGRGAKKWLKNVKGSGCASIM